MKKFLLIALAATIACFTGCKTVPEKETVGQKAYTAGLAAGYAAALIPKISAQDKTNIVVIVTVAERFIPQDGQTVTEAWTPVIAEAIASLQKQGKIDENQAALIKLGGDIAMRGIDYLLQKHPEWTASQEVVEVAVHQACNGFRTGIGINPNNPEVVELIQSIMDKDAFAACRGK